MAIVISRRLAVCACAALIALALAYTHSASMTSAVGLDGDADHSDAIDPLDVDGGKALQKKDNLALNLLSRMFGGGAKSKPAVSSKSSPAKKAALKRLIGKSPNYSSHRGRATASKAAAGIPPIPPPPHIMGALPGQGGPLAGPGGGDGPNPVQMGLQEIIMGWTGAGWWSPCTEVCTGGRTRAEMKVEETFKQFQACEANCRKSKSAQLKKVIARVRDKVAKEGVPGAATMPAFPPGGPGGIGGPGPGGPGGSPGGPQGPGGGGAGANEAQGPGTSGPPMVAQRVSKHLIKWAESQGLPAALANNPKDKAQVGQSVTGMLIASWTQAGWWKPCGEVCRGSKHFKEFMACEQKCQAVKSSLIEHTMNPKTFGPPQNAGQAASAKKTVKQ